MRGIKIVTALFVYICFSNFSATITWGIEWNMLDMRSQKHHGPLPLRMDSPIKFKCGSKLPSEFSGKMDIYMVDWSGYNECNATTGKLFATLDCSSSLMGNTKSLDFEKKAAQNYYFIGFARRKKEQSNLVGGTCKSHKTKFIIHICDPFLTQKGNVCSLKTCPVSLGMEDGRITDKQLSSSSDLDEKHTAKHGRLHVSSLKRLSDSSWCAAPFFDSGTQYLQVDLFSLHTISAVSTQGAPVKHSWVSSYLVHYSLGGVEWVVVTGQQQEIKEFKGNSDQSSVVRHWLEPHFHARYVRFVPLSWVGQRCMRVELYGCKKAPSVEELRRKLKEAPRPCEAAHCINVPHSTCFMYSSVPHCKCIATCALGSESVCGTDAESYGNECEMKRAACLSKKMINIHKRGPCPEPMACEGFCPSPYSRCVNRLGMEEKCECILRCPNVTKPVCGSDDVTYENTCLLRKMACEKKKEIMVIKRGTCRVKSKGNCPLPWTGKTCQVTANECRDNDECSPVMKCCYNGCRKVCVKPGQEIYVLPHSQCRVDRISGLVQCQCEEKCSFEYSPVCGNDGVTYSNECNLRLVACQNNNNKLAIQQQGECESKVKLTVMVPIVWRTDNQVFKSSAVVFIKPRVILPLVCPHQHEFVSNRQHAFCGVYLVSRADYEVCDMSRGKLILNCRVSKELQKMEVKGGKLFLLGHTHYLLASGPAHNANGATKVSTCKSHHMKLAVHVCDSPHDMVCDVCSLPLGVGDGRIEDFEITASSHLDAAHTAKFARLHDNSLTANPKTTWCAKKTLVPTEHLTVNLKSESLVSAVAIQDVIDSPGWVKKYELHYSINGNKWYKAVNKNSDKIFQGITTRSSVVRHWLNPRLYARFIRFVPTEWTRHRCMRVEVYGCTTTRKEGIEAHGRWNGTDQYISEVYYRTQQTSAINTGMCGDHLCPPYAKCHSADQGLKCVCPNCSHDNEEVCGSDGQFHKDTCHLQKKACKTNAAINVARSGLCRGKSIDNAPREPCSERQCPPHAQCVSFKNGTQKCVCPACASCGIRVCGSDGFTYRDLCELMTTACKKNKNITILRVGACAAASAKGVTLAATKGKGSYSLTTLFICLITVAILGLLIAFAMCSFQAQQRPVRTALRSASDRAITAFQSLHERFRKKDPVPHENRGDQDEESSAKNH